MRVNCGDVRAPGDRGRDRSDQYFQLCDKLTSLQLRRLLLRNHLLHSLKRRQVPLHRKWRRLHHRVGRRAIARGADLQRASLEVLLHRRSRLHGLRQSLVGQWVSRHKSQALGPADQEQHPYTQEPYQASQRGQDLRRCRAGHVRSFFLE